MNYESVRSHKSLVFKLCAENTVQYFDSRTFMKTFMLQKLVQSKKEDDFGLKELAKSMLTQFSPVCMYD